MSADEIRMLAESCKDKANYYKNMTPCSDAEKEKWYFDASKMEADKAAALFTYAAMIERCEKKRNELNDKIENIKKKGDYGCCGSCRYEDCGCVWRKGCYTLPAEIEIPIETINYILKGVSDDERAN